jgi:hypothetical protein
MHGAFKLSPDKLGRFESIQIILSANAGLRTRA